MKLIAICIILFIIISGFIIFIIYADVIIAFIVKMWDYVINAYDYAIQYWNEHEKEIIDYLNKLWREANNEVDSASNEMSNMSSL